MNGNQKYMEKIHVIKTEMQRISSEFHNNKLKERQIAKLIFSLIST